MASRRLPPWSCVPRRARASRAGITLLEVLISIFVLSIGLLGVAALIPAGRFTIVETSKADRAGACGRAGLEEVKIREMADPTRWLYCGGSSVGNESYSFVIDPLFVATELERTPPIQAQELEQISGFPYVSGANSFIRRMTLRTAAGQPMTLAQADWQILP